MVLARRHRLRDRRDAQGAHALPRLVLDDLCVWPTADVYAAARNRLARILYRPIRCCLACVKRARVHAHLPLRLRHMPASSDKAICGPKGTKEDPKAQGELGGLLLSLGYDKEKVFKF